MARAYTEDEIRQQFLEHLWTIARYWGGLDGSNVPADVDGFYRVTGFMHSALVLLDGGSGMMPAYRVSAHPHPDDRAYHIERGENYYPDHGPDIAGVLHELMYADGIRQDKEDSK